MTAANRRRHRRAAVAAIAVASPPGAPLAVWTVRDLSVGGAALSGRDALIPGQQARLTLMIAGRPAIPLVARVLRRQVARPSGRCAVVFEELSPGQSTALADAIANPAPTAEPAPTVLVLGRSAAVNSLVRELGVLGHVARVVESPFDAAVWLQHDAGVQGVLVEDKLLEVDGWSVMDFVREARPQIRRLAVSDGAASFRLHRAMRLGAVERLIEKPFSAQSLAQKLGFASDAGRARRKTRPG